MSAATTGREVVSVKSRANEVMSTEYDFATEAEREAYRKGFADGRWDVVSVLEDAVETIVWENKA